MVGYSKKMAIVMDEEDRLYAIACNDPCYYFPLGAAVDGDLLWKEDGNDNPGEIKKNEDIGVQDL